MKTQKECVLTNNTNTKDTACSEMVEQKRQSGRNAIFGTNGNRRFCSKINRQKKSESDSHVVFKMQDPNHDITLCNKDSFAVIKNKKGVYYEKILSPE